MTRQRQHPMDEAIRWRAHVHQMDEFDAQTEQGRWARRSAIICEEHAVRLLRDYLAAWGPAGLIVKH